MTVLRSLRWSSLVLLFCLLVSTLESGCGDSSVSLSGSQSTRGLGNRAFTDGANGTGQLPGGTGGPGSDDVKPGSGVPVDFGGVSQEGLFGIVNRASNGEAIEGATVTLIDAQQNTVNTQVTGATGAFGFGRPAAGEYTIITDADGFLSSERLVSYDGQDVGVGIALADPVSPGQLRIVLSWGLEPRDLDPHLFLPPATPYHLYFSRKGALDTCPFAVLDQDDVDSFGPETITIGQTFSGTYEYAVFIFAGEGDFNTSEAFVEIFDEDGRVNGFVPPAGGSEVWWHVFSLDGDSQQITPVNSLLNDFEPYPDTDAGCL